MGTNGLVKFIVVVIVLFLFISVGAYLLFRPSTTTPPNEADINAIYQVVGEFGARLKDVPDSSEASLALLIEDRGVGIRVVAGKRVLHTADGRDLAITKGSDGKETVGVHEYEAMYLQDELEVQYDIIRHEMSARTVAGVDSNLKRLITDRLYQEFKTYADVVPGKPVSGPYPEAIRIDSLQKLADTSYTVKASIILMTGTLDNANGNAGETPVTLTLKKVNGTWLIDDLLQSPTS
ncbi:MAG TPA: hypothetical protein VFB98_04790 [Candidatus Deferrimicrobium sp.]|nr:hypothetical protein [Candidatus Deferrimicrobium sp.]